MLAYLEELADYMCMAELGEVQLVNSDLVVSQIGYGTYHLGEKLDFISAVDSLRAAFEAGITLFDTSDNYQGSEAIIGHAILKGALPRDYITIATKTGLATSWYEAADWREHKIKADCSPNRVRAQLEKSLETMGVDEVGLYQYHVRDERVPHAEAAGVMNDLIDEGKIRAWGVSNYSNAEIDELIETCEAEGLQPPSTTQPAHSVLNGVLQQDPGRISVVAHSSLAKGLLVGSAVDRIQHVFSHIGGAELDAMEEQEREEILRAKRASELLAQLRDYAESYGLSLQQFAIGWILSRGAVALTSPTTPHYLSDLKVAVASTSNLAGEDPDDLEEIRRSMFDSRGLGTLLKIVMADKPYYQRGASV